MAETASPPSVLSDISPARGEIGSLDASDLAATVERARALLDDGDVIAARLLASGAYDQAKAAAGYAARHKAAGRLIDKARQLQGDALLIEARAKIRIAGEYDSAQEAGVVRGRGRPKIIPDREEFSAEDSGLSAKDIHLCRKLAEAERRSPGIVERAIAARLAAGLEPSRANLRAAVGTDSASAAERGNNLYETPPEAMRALLSVMRFSPTVWEPACGRGAISKMLEDAGYGVILADLVDYGTADRFGEVQKVGDFLQSQPGDIVGTEGADIVTNPPYGEVLNAFVAHALRVHRPKKMALLLNLNFLCGFDDPDRCFAMDDNPPATIWVFTRRLPMMHRDGWDGPEASSRMNTAWFVWELDEATGRYDAGGKRGTEIVRIDWKTFENSAPVGPLPISPLEGEMSDRTEAVSPTGQCDARLVELVAKGMQTEAGRVALVAAIDVMIEREEGGDIGGTAPPSVLSDISPSRGEIGQSPTPPLTPAQKVSSMAPGPGAPVEFSVGGMKKGSFAKFSISTAKKKTFDVSYSCDIHGHGGFSSPPHGGHESFAEALTHALSYLRLRFCLVTANANGHPHAAAKAGIAWCDARAAEWGLTLKTVEGEAHPAEGREKANDLAFSAPNARSASGGPA